MNAPAAMLNPRAADHERRVVQATGSEREHALTWANLDSLQREWLLGRARVSEPASTPYLQFRPSDRAAIRDAAGAALGMVAGMAGFLS